MLTNQKWAMAKRCGVGIDAEDGTQQYVEQQRAEGSNCDEEEYVRVDIGECLQAHLRGHSHAEDKDEDALKG